MKVTIRRLLQLQLLILRLLLMVRHIWVELLLTLEELLRVVVTISLMVIKRQAGRRG